ncbi:retention module-containing protein [Quatrionicoccus australiensis]|uniref:retention module-containing protein n=1 Tax=Quatrionicoccus australiensis TaxID=138118 RepID=UPI001CFA7F87|nr:retention module-containing protein [Quatrionicoccus australiensis]MCB4360469.1 retention module-containing protein [Quatrionicoccus australiensis]
MAQAQIIARVTSLSGAAFARDSAGNTRRLKTGDVIREGETVSATDGSEAMLKLADGRDLVVRPGLPAKLDGEVAAMIKPDATDSALSVNKKGFQKIAKALSSGGSLDTLLDEDAPAAGGVAGTGNEGHTFIELLRIAESVSGANGYQFDGTGNRSGNLAGSGAPILTTTFALTVDAPDNTKDTTPTISGRTELVPGSVITLTITDSAGLVQTVSTTVKGDGSFAVDVPAPLGQGNYTVVASGVDAAGNTGSGSDSGSVDSIAPTLTAQLDPASDSGTKGDGITNDQTPTISGTGEPASSIVVVMPGTGETLSTTVKADGTWSVTPSQNIPNNTSGQADVTETDSAGNVTHAKVDLSIDVAPPQISVDIDLIAGDGIVNKTESAAAAIPVTGTVSGAYQVGDPVSVLINGKEFTTTVQAGGKFSVNVSGADLTADSDHIIEVVVTTSDAAGNIGTAQAVENYTVNTTPPAIAISLDANVAGDGIVNKAESTAAAIPVTGTVSGQFNVGDTVIVTVNNKQFTTTVQAGGKFSVDVPGTDLATDSDRIVDAKVTTTDAAGNTATALDTQNYTVNTNPPAISISLDANVAGDGIVNKAESTAAAIPVTGTVSGAFNVGDTVTVTVNGKNFTGSVLAGGKFSIDVPGADLAADPDRIVDAKVSTTDAAGNTATALDTQNYTVNTNPPAISISLDANVAGDGIVNKAESTAAAIPVTGTVSGAFNVGDTVTVTVNGKNFTGSVLAGGKFSINVPGADLAADPDRIVDAKVSTTDAAGNTATALDTQNYTVNTNPPAISISLDANVAGDGIVNKTESTAAAIPVTGTVSGAFNVGDTVIITVNNKQFTTTVQAGGKFSVNVPGADLAADPDRIVDAKVSTTDAAGNTATALDTQNYTVNTNPPAISISLDANVAGDGIVNKAESTAAAIPVTGTVSGAFNVGDTVTVTVNGKNFTGSVLAGGKFSVNVPGADLAADPDRIVDAKVSTTDAAGNTATALDTQNYTVNTNPPAISISLDANVAGDGIVNKAESTAAAIPVTGTVSGAFNVGDTVTVTVNGKNFTGSVLAGGRFSINVPGADLAADGDRIVDAKVTTTDAAGNTATALDTQNYTVNTNPPAISISLDANVAGDGIVNLAESSATAIPVTGTVSGAFNVGDTVTVTVNGKNFTGSVLAGGKFSIDVPGADLAADGDRTVDAKVSTTDAAGNSATAFDTQDYRLATDLPKATIALDANFAGDGIINLAESTAAAIAVTGTVGGDVKLGDSVVVSVNGHNYTTTVIQRNATTLGFSVNVAGAELKADADHTIEARVTTSDGAGNQVSNTTSLTYAVDTTPPSPTIALDANFAGDGIINLAESTATAIAVTGTVGGDAKLGDAVVVTINGHDYATTVIQRNATTLGFNVDVPGAELKADADHTIEARVTSTDQAGNSATVDTSLTYAVDTTPPVPTIALDANFAGDGIINLAESTAAAIAVTGTVGGDAKLGDAVVVSINGKDYTTSVIQRNATTLGFSVDVPGAELKADADHTIEAKVTATDQAGNSATVDTSLTYAVDTTPPSPTIALDANFASDGIINLAESTAAAIAVTGTVGGDAKLGDAVVVTINGHDYATTVIQRNATTLGFSVDVPGHELAVDTDHTIEAKVTATDQAGNSATVDTSLTYTVDTTPPVPTIALDANFAGDGIINLAESTAAAIAVTGTVGGDAKLGDAVVVTINGHDYATTVIQRNATTLGFSVNVPGQELVADPDLTIVAQVTATDHAGNSATVDTSLTYALDILPPSATIALDANFAGDGIINLAESTAAAIAVTGTVGGDVKLGDPVVVSINGHDYATTVIQRNATTLGFSVDVPGSQLSADPDQTIEARVTTSDKAGNSASDQTSLTYTLDLAPPQPWIALDANFAGDGIINLAESTAAAIAVTGTVGGDAKLGDPVVVSINGHDYLTTVIQRNATTLGFSVDVPGKELAADPDLTIEAKVTSTDKAGNIASVDTSLTYTLDNTPPTINIDPLGISVSEEGLPGGNQDTVGSPDSTNARSASTTLTLDDKSAHLSLLTPPQNPSFTSGGKQIDWILETGGHKLIGYIDTPTGQQEVIVVTLDDQGKITTTLSKPIDHPAPGEDVRDLNIDVQATDKAGNVSQATLSIHVEDDMPKISSVHEITPLSDNGIYFTLSGENTPASHNVAPDVHAFSNSLLGLVGIDALNLIDLSGDQYQASDANNNITKLVIESGSLLSINLGGDEVLTWSQELASALGLKVELISDSGLLGLGSHFTLTITSLDPAHPVIDNLSIKELLSTLRVEDALLNLNVLDGATITASDAYGASNTATIGTLVDLSLLNGNEPANVMAGTASDDTITGDDKSNILLGNEGKDILAGMGGNDALHGGSGDDRLDGGTGNDLLIGGAGNDALHGGDGNDVYSWNLNDRGVAGKPAIDTIDDFSNGRDILRITGLLTGNGIDSSLPHKLQDYVYIEKTATGDAIIHISSTGGFAAGYDANKEDQRIILTGYGSHLSGNSDSDLRSMLDNHQLIVGNDTPITTPGGSDQAQGSLGSFGADGGHVEKVTVNGHTYGYADADSTTHVLTIHTAAGETIVINMDDGTYHYTATTPLTKGHYTAVDYTLVDNDGDTASSTLRFMGTADPVNVAPDTNIDTSNNLLGIIGLATLNLIDISTQQAFTAFDANENLSKVEIKYSSFLTLGTDRIAASQALAHELGLSISVVDTYSFLGAESVLTITSATPGGTISNLAVNELLGTVYLDQSSLVDLSVGNSYSITATDSQGLSHTSNDFTLLDLNLLNNPASHTGIQEGSTGNDTLTGTAGSDRLYGYAGNDILAAGDDNDLIRAGAGNDQLSGGNGTDILIGSAGNDILIGDAGSDIFRWEFADQGNAQAPAVDIIADFETRAGGDLLDLRDLLQNEFHMGSDIGNLDNYLHFSTSGGNTIIDIKPTGASGAVTQEIVLYGVDLSHNGALNSDALIIQSLLQNGKLLTD